MWTLKIDNIGGIRSGETTIDDGLNVVQASNFQGKSSFIDAIQTVMGTTGMFDKEHPLTEGADEGTVVLETEDGDYEVNLSREPTGVSTRSGNPYLTDETDRVCAHLFAFLGEDNPIRSAVRNQEDITDLLQEPLNIEDINAQISALQKERKEVERRLEDAEQAAKNLPSVQEAITQLEDDLEELRARRDELSEEVSDEASNASKLGDQLANKQGSLDSVEQTISRLESRIERKEEALEQKQEELDELEIPSEPDITADIEDKEDRISDLELKIGLLEDLHRANQQVLEENELDLVTDVERSIAGDEISCWVCGEETTADDIEDRLEALKSKIQSLREEKSQLNTEIQEIEQRQREIREKKQKQDQLENAIGNIKADIQDAKGELQQSKSRKEELETEIEDLQQEVEEAEEELNEELTDVKAEINSKERELERKQSQLEELKEKSSEADELEEERDELSEQIEQLRKRKTEKQNELKEQFDAAIEDVIDEFAPGFDGAYLDTKTSPNGDIEKFELKIAREGRETTLGRLSEGERELVGIVVAVAGYRTYNVGERVPAILIDGIGQLASENLQRLTTYLEDASDILVTTAYPEAGDFGGATISPDEWDVVSDQEPAPA